MILVHDCNYLCWSACHAGTQMECDGVPTDVMFKFLKRIYSFYEKYTDAYNMVFCWDSRQSLRRRIYPPYKVKDQSDLDEDELKKRDDCRIQMKILRKEILPAMGFKNVLHQVGYEADDLIATTVHCYGTLKGLPARPDENKVYEDPDYLIISADEDLFQLLDYANQYSPATKETWTAEKFVYEKGIKPAAWKYVKQLAGCSSDKIPGVRGVGEATAIKYLLGELKEESKKCQSIRNLDQTVTNRNSKLVNLPFHGTQTSDIRSNEWDGQAFMEICKKYGFISFIRDIEKWDDLFYAMD